MRCILGLREVGVHVLVRRIRREVWGWKHRPWEGIKMVTKEGEGNGVRICAPSCASSCAGLGLLLVLLLLLMGAGVGTAQSLQEECSVELYARIFKPGLGQTNTPYALVQFFASGSPACQEYKPHFERVACLFNDPHPVHEGEVIVTKVDCAIESNKGLCERFNVESYPTMYWGPPEILASGGGSTSIAKLGLDSVDGGDVSTADDLLEWINKRINKQYALTDKRPEAKQSNEIAITTKQPSAWPPALWQEKLPGTLLDVEEATAHAFSYMMDEKRIRSSSRGSFIQFIRLLARHHPSRRCREGSVKVLQNLAAWWPRRQPPENALREQQLCGPGLPRGFWIKTWAEILMNEWVVQETCDGDGRGYNCGLWLLLHSLTVQVEDVEGTFAVSAINAFVNDFYQCDQCRDHFQNVSDRNLPDSASTKKHVVLWLWKTHNKITEVIAKEGYEVKGNSTRKVLWPLEKECPACRDSSGDVLGWDEEAVYYYLMDFYRQREENQLSQVQQPAEKSVVGVPYWAAGSIAIAIGSCGLGFATFYLRAFTQKYKPLPQRP